MDRTFAHSRTAALAAALALLAGAATAAVRAKPATPLPLEESAAEPATEPSLEFAGAIIFVRGDQVVAEISGGAREGEYLLVLDERLRRVGKAAVARDLGQGTFLLARAGSFSVSPGDRLLREPEAEAAARVLRQGRLDGYRAFLANFPNSALRDRVAREMFRLSMQSSYPARPGSSLEGRIRLAEDPGREISLEDVAVVVDRYVIARSDAEGRFRVAGLPAADASVTLAVRVKDPRLRMAEAVAVEVPAGKLADLTTELPVLLEPTVLEGRVLDAEGNPLEGAEVWTHPYTVELLTDEDGNYRISRRKERDAAGALSGADHPLFGGEFEVYARRAGFGVERVRVSAASHAASTVPLLELQPSDPLQEEVPPLELSLREHMALDAAALATPQGAAPLLNP